MIAIPPAPSEAEFQAMIIELAHLCRWRVAHFRAALTRRGWRTPVAGDGAGFPDLVLVRGNRVVVAELKSMTGKVTPEQTAWLDAFGAAGVEDHVWRPTDWDAIVEALR